MKKIFSFFVLISLFVLSCSKSPGTGGTSTIRGRIWVRQYDKACSTLNSAYWGYKQTVYIQYGNGVGLNANGGSTQTDYNGYFEFDFMLNGSYTLFVYSADSTKIVGPPLNPTAPQKAIVWTTSISKRKQTVDQGTIDILVAK